MTMAEQVNGLTTIAFTRIRVTEDSFPIDVPLNDPVYVLWAIGTDNDQTEQRINYHATNRGLSSQLISFPSAVDCPFIGKNNCMLLMTHMF